MMARAAVAVAAVALGAGRAAGDDVVSDDGGVIVVPADGVYDVVAQPRSPWNGMVDIDFRVEGDLAAAAHPVSTVSLVVTMKSQNNRPPYTYTARSLAGDTSASSGWHRVTWNLCGAGEPFNPGGASGGDPLPPGSVSVGDRLRTMENAVFTVAYRTSFEAPYLSIDLEGPSGMSSVTALDAAAGALAALDGNTRHKKLVLRRIAPGAFARAEPDDPPGTIYLSPTYITKPFYIGVFETTQEQWALLMDGAWPSYNTHGSRYTKPVERVSWRDIRGDSAQHDWPTQRTVDSNSFMGRLRARTRLPFDLPTRAQWEYACRAGTTSYYNNGGNTPGDLRSLGLFAGNASATGNIGSRASNDWGLYDMHGNVAEWTLDYYSDTRPTGTDPVGASSRADGKRTACGGSCYDPSEQCRSDSAWGAYPTNTHNFVGFRVACAAETTEIASCSSAPLAAVLEKPDPYLVWATANGLGAKDEVTDGVANIVRFAFDRPTGAFSPIASIEVVASNAVVTTLTNVSADVTLRALVSRDVASWAGAETNDMAEAADGARQLTYPAVEPRLFFRLDIGEAVR